MVQSVPQIVRQVEKTRTLEERSAGNRGSGRNQTIDRQIRSLGALGEAAELARLFTGDGVNNRAEERIHQISWTWATTISFLKAHSHAVAVGLIDSIER
jgi:hypothetical protein